MNKWFLPTISEILANSESYSNFSSSIIESDCSKNQNENIRYSRQSLKAEKEWYSAIASLNQLLTKFIAPLNSENNVPIQGLILSGPTVILSEPHLNNVCATGVFTSDLNNNLDCGSQAHQYLPLPSPNYSPKNADQKQHKPSILPLLTGDPLAQERFCVVFTNQFSLVLCLGENLQGEPTFFFSFEPEAIERIWLTLRYRLLMPIFCQQANDRIAQLNLVNLDDSTLLNTLNNQKVTFLDSLLQQFQPVVPDYKIVLNFSQMILQNLPLTEVKSDPVKQTNFSDARAEPEHEYKVDKEIELLQAIAHEIRTPLTTIRTLTRLLLKQRNLSKKITDKLQLIDQECTHQIDRFSLIFRAVEMEASYQQKRQTEGINNRKTGSKKGDRDREYCPHPSMTFQLTPIPVSEVFQTNLDKWQKQAHQRQHTLEVNLPQKLPKVVSDPIMLEQILTGLIESFTRSLPTGSHIQVDVMLAGNKLKLQLESQPKNGELGCSQSEKSNLQSLGPLLMFQPETGCLSLNLTVTKNLFQAIGGKLVVRHKPQQVEVMTVFLPLQ